MLRRHRSLRLVWTQRAPAWRAAWTLLALTSASSAAAAQQDPVTVQPAAEVVTVTARAPEDVIPAGTQRVTLHANQARVADALDALSGVRLVRTGGEGAAFQLSVRGMSGRRVATYLGPVRLDDPVTGVLDLGELPGAALGTLTLTKGATATSEGGLGGVLQLHPVVPVIPVLRGSITAGSERLLVTDVSAGAPMQLGRLFVGAVASARLSTTNGVFRYQPVAGSKEAPVVLAPRTRVNNDRHRVGLTVASAFEWLGGPSGNAVLDASVLQGGIPGFGLQPLTSAREQQSRTAAGGEVRLPLPHGVELSASTSARHAAWRFEDARLDGHVLGSLQSAGGQAGVGGQVLVFPQLLAQAQVQTHLDAALSRGDAGGYRAARPAVSGSLGLVGTLWDGRFSFVLRTRTQAWLTQLSGETRSRPGLQGVVTPEVRVATQPFSGVTLEAHLARAWRNPSLEEMYRPRNATLAGNPELRPEDGAEAGVAARAQLGVLRGLASLYGARMSNMIAYVNINAFDVRPLNVGGVWRAGGELEAALLLGRWGEVALGADVNFSRVDVSGYGLPTVPPLELRAATRLGPPRARVFAEATARSAAPGNLYGELPVRPALRLNGGVEVALFAGITTRVLVRNLLDDQSQTDLWGIPQPGREAFVTFAWEPGAPLGPTLF